MKQGNALYYAVTWGFFEIMEMLLQDERVTSLDRNCALQQSASAGRRDVVRDNY